MALRAKLYRPAPENRQADRQAVDLEGTLRDPEGKPVDVEIENLSRNGVGLLSAERIPVGTRIWIGIPGLGRRPARVIRRDDDLHGCEFDVPLGAGDIEKAITADTVVGTAFNTVDSPPGTLPEEVVEKWPLLARAFFIAAASLTLWAIIILLGVEAALS